MAGFAEVHVMGNLVRDPELKYTPQGNAVCTATLAVSRGKKGEEQTSFFDCVFWGKSAETVAEYFRKGNPIVAHGELIQDSWQDKETGQKRNKIKIQSRGFTFLPRSGKKTDSENDGAPAPRKKPDLDDDFGNNDGSDIPF